MKGLFLRVYRHYSCVVEPDIGKGMPEYSQQQFPYWGYSKSSFPEISKLHSRRFCCNCNLHIAASSLTQMQQRRVTHLEKKLPVLDFIGQSLPHRLPRIFIQGNDKYSKICIVFQFSFKCFGRELPPEFSLHFVSVGIPLFTLYRDWKLLFFPCVLHLVK